MDFHFKDSNKMFNVVILTHFGNIDFNFSDAICALVLTENLNIKRRPPNK